LKYSFQTGLLFFLCVAATFAQNTVLAVDSEPGFPSADDREAAILATLPVGATLRLFEARLERLESLWWNFIVCPECVSINSWMVDSRASRDMLFVMLSADGVLFLSRSFSSA
jgi:hypothetical protein